MTSTESDAIISKRHAATPARQRRVMTGDRFCTKCGYNLVGQEIIREEHYDLLIIRCPECATVTGLHEYPLLGTWGPRLGVALAALWMLLLLGLWTASSGGLLGFGVSIVEDGSRNYGRYLEGLQEADAALTAPLPAQPPATSTAATQITPQQQLLPGTVTIGGTTIVLGGGGRTGAQFGAWWDKQDKSAALASAGGWFGAFDHVELLFFIPAGVVAFLIGCFWSVFLIQLPRRWLVICAVAIVGLSCALAFIPVLEWESRSATSARRAAEFQLAVPTLAIYYSFVLVLLTAGLYSGRSLARLAVAALLPPKLRGPIALLWSADGKEPTTGRAA